MSESVFTLEVGLHRLMEQREDLLAKFSAAKAVEDQVRLGNAIEALEGQIIDHARPTAMAKVDNVRSYRLHATMLQAAAKEEKDRQAANERHWKSTIDFLDRCVLQTMEAVGKDRLDGKTGHLRSQVNSAAPAPVISQPDLVPLSLCTVTVEFRGDIWDGVLDNFAVIDRALETGTAKIKARGPSTSLIKAELEEGNPVAGCYLPEKSKHVRIGA